MLMKRLIWIIASIIALSLWAGACGGENQLKEVAVCTGVVNDRCPESMSVIPADSPAIYTAGRLKSAVEGTQVSATLINFADDEPVELLTFTITINKINKDGDSYPVFYFTNTDPWTRGPYQVRMHVEGSESDPVVMDFEVG